MNKSAVTAAIKLPIFYALYHLGRVHRTPGIPILAYHSIDDSGSPISLSPRAFEAQLRYLRTAGYQSATLHDARRWARGELALPGKRIVLTFDDGFQSNATHALPLLNRYGFTATVFLVTDYAGRSMTWRKVRHIPDLPMLAWSEIQDMHAQGIDFQPHSASHLFLTSLSDADLEKEIRSSSQAIASRLGRPCSFFCYPYGLHDARVRRAVAKAGLAGACSLTYGKVQVGDDPYALPRIGIEHVGGQNARLKLLFLKAALDGAADWYIRTRRYLPFLFAKPSLGDEGKKEES